MAEGKERIGCPNCGARYRVPSDWLGRRVACRRCGERFLLTTETATDSGAPASETALSDNDATELLGRLAVRFKMLSSDQLRRALALQSRQSPQDRERLGDILISSGLLSHRQLDFLTSIQQLKVNRIAERRFGELAIQQGVTTAEEVERVLEEQKRRFLDHGEKVSIGDLLVEQGCLTAEQRESLLNEQQRSGTPPPSPLFSLQLSDDGLSASASLVGDDTPTQERVAAELKREGILFGIDSEAVDALCRGEVPPGEWLAIARGEAARPAVDARVDYMFETQPVKAGRQGEHGLVDFRDRGEIPQVAPGDVLARKTAAQPGEAGTDIFGHPLEPEEPRDVLMSAGSGTELSGDGSSVVASEEGRPSVSALGVVSVYPEYRVEGDIGLDTGHVDFHGRVVVPGVVESGFRVRCGELVAGEIREADIEAVGNVSVAGGIIGGRIHAGGDVRLHYLQKARLEVTGNVVIDKEAVDSQVECGGSFLSPRCVILGCKITARKGIFVAAVGSEAAAASRFAVGVDEPGVKELGHLKAAAAERQTAIDQHESEREKLQARLDELEQLVGEEAQFQDRAMARQRELRQSLQAMENAGLADKAESFRQELAELEPRIAGAEQRLAEWFAEQERITERLDHLPEQLRQLQDEFGSLEEEQQRLHFWLEQETGVAVVQVDGTLDQHTLIRTPHVEEVRLGGNYRHIRLEEQLSRDRQGGMRWRVGAADWKPPKA